MNGMHVQTCRSICFIINMYRQMYDTDQGLVVNILILTLFFFVFSVVEFLELSNKFVTVVVANV